MLQPFSRTVLLSSFECILLEKCFCILHLRSQTFNLGSLSFVYEYMCRRCNSSYYGETERQLKVRSGEHIGISRLTFKKTKPSKESSIRDHLL